MSLRSASIGGTATWPDGKRQNREPRAHTQQTHQLPPYHETPHVQNSPSAAMSRLAVRQPSSPGVLFGPPFALRSAQFFKRRPVGVTLAVESTASRREHAEMRRQEEPSSGLGLQRPLNGHAPRAPTSNAREPAPAQNLALRASSNA